MTEFTHEDREVMRAEQTMWNVVALLDEAASGEHGFAKKAESIRESALALATELRDYNDQFEVDDDE